MYTTLKKTDKCAIKAKLCEYNNNKSQNRICLPLLHFHCRLRL